MEEQTQKNQINSKKQSNFRSFEEEITSFPFLEEQKENFYEFLISRKLIKKRSRKNNPKFRIMFLKFIQPITDYQIGDFVVQDSIIKNPTTTLSNSQLTALNSLKKITKSEFERSTNMISFYLSSYGTINSPSINLLIDRLCSLSSTDAKALSNTILNMQSQFSSAQAAISQPNLNEQMFVELEKIKSIKEKEFFESLDHCKPFYIVNSHFNQERKCFEIYRIKMNKVLLGILGYIDIEFFAKECLKSGFPSIYSLGSYFSDLNNIILSRSAGKDMRLELNLIRSDESLIYCEATTKTCNQMIFGHFLSFSAIIFEINPLIIKRIQERPGNSSSDMKEKMEEVHVFIKDFYPEKLEKKLEEEKLAFRTAGLKFIPKEK